VVFASRSSPGARSRFILKDGKLQKLPSGPLSLLMSSSPLTKGLVMAGISEALSFGGGSRHGDDESIYSFAARKFGAGAAENLFDPMCHGIFAGDARQLSVRSCFPWLYQADRASGSVIRSLLFPASGASVPEEEVVEDQAAEAFVQRMSKYPMWSFKDGLEVVGSSLLPLLASLPHSHIFI